MSGTVHIIGAGLSGLSAAVELAGSGRRVVVHEAAKFAGGRCRAYYDSVIGMEIDNGNHLLLSGNHAALSFLRRIGGMGAMSEAAEAAFPFADLATGERWTLRPNAGRLPWWVLDARRRVPGTRAGDYLAPLGILRARDGQTVGEVMRCEGPLYERLWRPVLLSALNTDPAESDARLAAQIIRETLAAGGDACRPLVATGGLSAAFIDPALAYLARNGAEMRLAHSLKAIRFEAGRAAALEFADGPVELGPDDAAALAVPAMVAPSLVPGLDAPRSFHAIANAHFRIAPPPGLPLVLGVVNATTEWLFAYSDRLSVTISAADALMDLPREALAERIWGEIATLCGLAEPLPRWQIVRERRATFAATPAEARRRPPASTDAGNLVLAGDWTDTKLPSTIEGSIRSGVAAAALLQRRPASAGAARAA